MHEQLEAQNNSTLTNVNGVFPVFQYFFYNENIHVRPVFPILVLRVVREKIERKKGGKKRLLTRIKIKKNPH